MCSITSICTSSNRVQRYPIRSLLRNRRRSSSSHSVALSWGYLVTCIHVSLCQCVNVTRDSVTRDSVTDIKKPISKTGFNTSESRFKRLIPIRKPNQVHQLESPLNSELGGLRSTLALTLESWKYQRRKRAFECANGKMQFLTC